jgi:sortase A
MFQSRIQAAGKARRRLANLLLLAGATAAGVWVWSLVRGAIVQSSDSSAFERRIRDEPAAVNAEAAPRALANGDLLGRLVIPRLNLRAMVREGAGEDTLGVALGHIPGTALPGQSGNVGVAGHRDTLFRALHKIARNDHIQFQTLAGSYVYEVESTAIVAPQYVAVLAAGQHPELTLVTCYPFYYVGPAPDRFVVKARLVSQDPPRQGVPQISERTRSSPPPLRP